MAFNIGGYTGFQSADEFKKYLDNANPNQVTQDMQREKVNVDDLTKAYNTAYGKNITADQGQQWLSGVPISDAANNDPNPDSWKSVLMPGDPGYLEAGGNPALMPGVNDGNNPGFSGNNTGLDLFGHDISGLGSKSTNFSGLDEESRRQIISSLLPQLLSSSSNLSGLADDSTRQAAELSRRTATGLAKQELPALIDQLSAKGTLNSSFGGEKALSDLFSRITKDAGDRTYLSGIEASRQKQDIPKTLGNLLGLGQYSQSESTDTLEPYKLIANLIANLQ